MVLGRQASPLDDLYSACSEPPPSPPGHEFANHFSYLMPGRIPPRPRQCLRLVETTRLRIQSRPYSTRDPVTNDDALESTIHRDENLHRSFRLRPGGKPLPLPPSLDPIVASERSQWEQTKKRPNVAEFTPFQKKLWENPYGMPFKLGTRRKGREKDKF